MSDVEASRERVEGALFTVATWLVFAFMLTPIVVVVVTSFQQSAYLSFPPQGFSLDWYAQFFASPQWLGAVMDSLVIAAGSSALATVFGVSSSLGTQRSDIEWTRLLPPVMLMPLLVPPVVLGLGLLIYFNSIHVSNDYVAVIIAHTLWTTPLVFFIMQSVFSRFDWNLWDAGTDLGARPGQVFYHVVLPNVRGGLIISALIAFIVSLQEFIMALFLTSFGTRTVSVLAWIQLEQSLTPMVSVVSTFLVLASVLAVLVSAAVMNLEWLADQL